VRKRSDTRPGRLRTALEPSQWRACGLLASAILGLHLAGFAILLAATGSYHGNVGRGGGFGLGLGITAYTLGLRHAFDADHVSAIDNATRKLMRDGQRPLSVGFFFSLGHSTIVLALAALVGLGVSGVSGAVQDGSSTVHQAGSVIGPTISAVFLLLIGLLNLTVLVNVLGIFRRMRRGECGEQELERELSRRGLASRLYGTATRRVRAPWQMYPIGALFGLGFDTATEVALLVLAAAGAAGGLPFYAILCLPLLFAAGMSLLDTLDGALMCGAYAWAFVRPVRKAFYNIAITGLSVAVALVIGVLELSSAAVKGLGLTGGAWSWLSAVDLNDVGYAIVGLFVLTWALAVAVWRLGRVEERWSAQPDSR
jgi:high-affinity nickel-transport protein